MKLTRKRDSFRTQNLSKKKLKKNHQNQIDDEVLNDEVELDDIGIIVLLNSQNLLM
jgi:hypothetical protein